MKYLGHIVSVEGVKVDPDKIAEMKDWKTPGSEQELRSFEGLAGYFRKSIKGFSQIATPLHATLSKHENNNTGKKNSTKQIPFQKKWNSKCSVAFENLKTCFISTPILGFPDFRSPFILETNASFDGLGAV